MSKKQITVIVIIVVAILAVVVCIVLGLWLWNRNNIIKNAMSPDETQMLAAVESNDINVCGNISDKPTSEACRSLIAGNKAKELIDYSYCNMINDKMFSKGQCLFDVALAKATKNDSVSACAEIDKMGYPSMANQCTLNFWFSKARDGKNTTLCNNITRSEDKAFCVEQISSLLK